jgi:hypothetical protein
MCICETLSSLLLTRLVLYLNADIIDGSLLRAFCNSSFRRDNAEAMNLVSAYTLDVNLALYFQPTFNLSINLKIQFLVLR